MDWMSSLIFNFARGVMHEMSFNLFMSNSTITAPNCMRFVQTFFWIIAQNCSSIPMWVDCCILHLSTTDNFIVVFCGWRLSNGLAQTYSNFHSHIRNLQVTICTKLRLQKYFNTAELPDELGGTLVHDFELWFKNRIVSYLTCRHSHYRSLHTHTHTIHRCFFLLLLLLLFLVVTQRIDDFRKSYNKMMVDLSTIIESLNDLKAHQISEINETLSERSATNVETQNIIKLIMKSGKSMTYIKI